MVEMLKHPGHFTSIKYVSGDWTSRLSLCVCFSCASEGLSRSMVSWWMEGVGFVSRVYVDKTVFKSKANMGSWVVILKHSHRWFYQDYNNFDLVKMCTAYYRYRSWLILFIFTEKIHQLIWVLTVIVFYDRKRWKRKGEKNGSFNLYGSSSDLTAVNLPERKQFLWANTVFFENG
jgi:hypothetical protein